MPRGVYERDAEYRNNISNKLKGRVVSEETKRRMSEAHRRRQTRREVYVDKDGYQLVYGTDDHPLTTQSGLIKEHRKVLYDSIGPGPHLCYWGCESILYWDGIYGIVPDHLNGDPADNRIENLVPSCNSCNVRRQRAGNPANWRRSP